MQVKDLQLKRALRTALLVLLLNAVGMGKMYAYDFSAVCETGQTLYYNITNATNHYVALVAPGGNNSSGWNGYTKPTGDIILPDSVQYNGETYFVTSIGSYAFLHCNGLTGNLTIPNFVTSIGKEAFYYCSGFTGSLTLSNSVTSIGYYAFFRCDGFSGSLTIPNSVTSIGMNAFAYCSGFTGSLNIPNSVISIGDGAFESCRGFTGSLTIGNSVTTIGNHAFDDCDGFTGSLTIPNSVTSIGSNAFDNCWRFTGSLTIPNSVTTIGGSAFYGCRGFTGCLTIPNSVISIGSEAFRGCENFESIVVEFGNTVYDSRENCNALIKTSTNELLFGCKNTIIPNSVTSIGSYAFYNCSGLTGNLIIPNSVTSIGDWAFYYCNGLTGNLHIPNSVTMIGIFAFYNCSGFTGSLTISNSVTSIGMNAFAYCSGLTGDLTIPNSVTTIGGLAFFNCRGLAGSLIIPNSVTSIGGEAFSICRFDSIVVESGNTVYDSRENCNAIIKTSINALIQGCKNTIIPNSVTSIGGSAFRWCGLTGSLTIPNSVTSIGIYAFNGCNLTNLMMLGTTPPLLGQGVFTTTYLSIYVPYESLNDYKTATNWSDYESRIFPWLQRSIEGYGEDTGNWCFIASPCVANKAPTAVNNMITETAYDLYRFDQSEDLEWRNYEDPENTQDFMLVNGQGYLYANEEDVNLIFKGNFNEDDTKEVALAYTEDNPTTAMRGWNLIGNPFPVNAYADRSYYVMNEDGTAIEPVAVSMETAIPACTGIMVKADNLGESVIFSKTAPEAASNQGVLQIALSQVVEPVETPVNRGGSPSTLRQAQGPALIDKAIVSFNAGDALEKFVFNADNAQLYIPQSGKEYAIAYAEKQGEMPLNFKAIKDGTYTLSVNAVGKEFDYLHLIDNLTGADVDLLNPEPVEGPATYTFTAKTTDYASRFRLVFICGDASAGSASDAPFAFVSNGQIILTGIGADTCDVSLQVIDMQGRVVVSVGGRTQCVPTAGMTPGVYVLHLIQGDSVRTQKMVIE